MMARSKWLAPGLGLLLLVILAGCEEPHPVGPLSPSMLPPGAHLTSLSFVDADHGWVVAADCTQGGGTPTSGCRALVYGTTDGGHSWSPEGRLLLVPRKLQFTDSSTGWVVGGIGQQCGDAACPNVVMQTTDAGRSWQRTLTTSVDLIDLSFASPRDGWILGETCETKAACKATLVSTASTGQTWSNQDLPLTGHGFRLARISPSVGWVGAIDNGQAVLIATRDDGKHWDKVETPCHGESLAFDFRSPTAGWLACSGGAGGGSATDGLYRTADGGQTWQTLPPLSTGTAANQPGGAVATLAFTSPNDGWIVEGEGEVLATHDGGKTWSLALAAKQSLAAGTFVDSTHGWVVGNQTIWATANGGKSWDKSEA